MIVINTFEDVNGRIVISTAGGNTLVDGNSFRNLDTQVNAFGHKDIFWVDDDGSTVNITDRLSDGKLKGWVDVRDVEIGSYLSRLDLLAQGIMDEVNNLHQSGYGLDESTGNNFFTGASTAAGIRCMISGVSPTDLGCSAGSPIGSVPSGSSFAFR